MSNIWFTSDAHFGHRNIHLMRLGLAAAIQNDDRIAAAWTELVCPKRDTVYCLGDMAFDEMALRKIHALPGRKVLIAGNHDWMHEPAWRDVYDRVGGIEKYKKLWLTHAPIHPDELRGKVNVHGHVHYATVQDPRYFNICPESLDEKFGRPMITLVELRAWVTERFPEYYAP